MDEFAGDVDTPNRRLLDPQYREGYAAGYADAMNEMMRECKLRLEGTEVLSDLAYHAASCLEDVADLLDTTEPLGGYPSRPMGE